MQTIEVTKADMLTAGCSSSKLYDLLKPLMLAEGMDVDRPTTMEFDHEKQVVRWSQHMVKAVDPDEDEEEEEDEDVEVEEEEEEEPEKAPAHRRRTRGGRRR